MTKFATIWRETEPGLFVEEITPRELDSGEIRALATGADVKRVAVENFLGTIDVELELDAHVDNMHLDAALYRWNRATQNAILRGLLIAYGQSK